MAQDKPTALVVDDEASVRTLIQRALGEAGYHVFTAASGEEALSLLSQSEVEVMLLDIRMPGLSGLEVLKRVQAERPDTSVIMVTAVADTQTAVETMKVGAYDYLIKPFSLNDLVFRVRKASERRRLVLQNRGYQRELEKKVQEQARRLEQQFAQLIQSLAREHASVLAMESQGRSGRGKEALSKLPPELQKPAASVEQFAKALLEVIKSGGLKEG